MTPETRKRVFVRGGFFCAVCGRPVKAAGTPQVAHCIHKGKQSENYIMAFIWNEYKKDRNRAFVRENILEHELNLRAVCNDKCNDACNIFFNDIKRDNLIREIIEKSGCLAL